MSATAVNLPARNLRFWQTTVGKKAIMAVTGFILFGFVVGHLIGNLQIFLEPEKINRYAALLKSLPALLWGTRITLLVAVGLHIWSSFQLWLLQREARPIKYIKKANLNSTYASRTMLWSGPIVGAFVVFHVLHLTVGSVLPLEDIGGNPDTPNVYHNVVAGFQNPWVSGFYILAMILLCLHLYHGLWSMFQSVGFSHPRYTPMLKKGAAAFAILIAIGNCSIPIAVMAGLLRL